VLHLTVGYALDVNVMEAILNKTNDINVNIQNNAGNTVLHLAAGYGLDDEVLIALLNKGAKKHVTNRHGNTPWDCWDKDNDLLRNVAGQENSTVDFLKLVVKEPGNLVFQGVVGEIFPDKTCSLTTKHKPYTLFNSPLIP